MAVLSPESPASIVFAKTIIEYMSFSRYFYQFHLPNQKLTCSIKKKIHIKIEVCLILIHVIFIIVYFCQCNSRFRRFSYSYACSLASGVCPFVIVFTQLCRNAIFYRLGIILNKCACCIRVN